METVYGGQVRWLGGWAMQSTIVGDVVVGGGNGSGRTAVKT